VVNGHALSLEFVAVLTADCLDLAAPNYLTADFPGVTKYIRTVQAIGTRLQQMAAPWAWRFKRGVLVASVYRIPLLLAYVGQFSLWLMHIRIDLFHFI